MYTNPIARHGDFADPFVLRFDGIYYLYATNPDVRCWTSSDLVEWQPAGATVSPDVFPGLVPFAPEVVYHNGVFYLYTSPSGHGHFVLASESPTGPFLPVTPNVGHAIDGSVFIDDDGRWYFYWADDAGIWGCEMPSPTEFGTPVFTGVHMNGWTEGPMVVKRAGRYTMTLTGNHYLSPGYRINAAFSDDPLRGFRDVPLGPVLVSTTGPRVGLGHNSIVTGPDLVSHWVCYHNLNPDASRDLNLDRVRGSGETFTVLGPTACAPRPAGPDEQWTADAPAVGAGAFTAEINVLGAEGDYGMRLGSDVVVRVEPATQRVTVSAGVFEQVTALPADFRHGVLHCWLWRFDGERLEIAVDSRSVFRGAAAFDAADALRGFDEAAGPRLGRCSLTRSTLSLADADADAVLPVPGRFWCGADVAGHRLAAAEELTYRIFVQDAGTMRVYVDGDFRRGDELSIAVGSDVRPVTIEAPTTVVAVTADLDSGEQELRIRAVSGAPRPTLVTVAPVPTQAQEPVSGLGLAGWAKEPIGPGTWDDCRIDVSAAVEFAEDDGHADVLFRAGQFADGGEGDDPVLGTDFLLGYSLQIHRDRVVLARHRYDAVTIADAVTDTARFAAGFSITVCGDVIRVHEGDRLLLEAEDEHAPRLGMVGVRTAGARIQVDSLTVNAAR